MTFKEAMIKEMTSRGMFDSQAIDVIDSYIEENKDIPIMDVWQKDINSYPEGIQRTLWIGVKEYAYNWIIANAPQAWFRPMFQYSDVELTAMINAKKNSMG